MNTASERAAKVTIALLFDSGARPKLPRFYGCGSRSNIVRHGFGNKSKINTVRKGIGMHNFENQTAHQIT